MVCSRCKMVVSNVFKNTGIATTSLELGEVELTKTPSALKMLQLNKELTTLGFEIFDDKRVQTIEKIKNLIINLVHHTQEDNKTTLSVYITSQIFQDYNTLSNLFSEVEGTTIEKYFISQKIERVKELLMYNEMTLSQIADKLGYSSVAYLSNQFKKITGLSPSHFKALKEKKRKNIEDL